MQKRISILCFFLLVSCSQDVKFGPSVKKTRDSADSVSNGATPGAAIPPTTSDGIGRSHCDLSKDFVKVSFPPKIEACNQAGKIWDFARDACSDVPKTTDFECTFDGFIAAAKKIGISDDRISQNQAKGAKLVACGEKPGIVLAQWFIPTEEQKATSSCSAQGAHFVTACYSNSLSQAANDSDMVAACLGK
jgi:hypothetical protein